MTRTDAENTNTRRRYGSDDSFVGPIAQRALVEALATAMRERGFSLKDEAAFLGTPTQLLEKILGDSVNVSLDTLVSWLMAVGYPVEIKLGPRDKIKEGPLTVITF
jgi:acyl-CoA thioester hydrolase